MAEIILSDYPTVAVSLLVQHYSDSEDVKKLLRAMTAAEMPLQTAMLEIRDRFIITTATGAELNILGNVWDEPRNFESDADYRYRIQVKISLSISGTVPEIKRVLFVIYGATYTTYGPGYPAGLHIDTDADISQENLEKLLPAGVFGVKWPDVDPGNYLIDSDGNYLVDSASYPRIDSDV